MEINIQFVHMKTSESMKLYTENKLNSLAEKYPWLIKAAVFFKIENDSKGKGKICEVELSLNGPRIFASSNEKNYELAVKETISDLNKKLKKRKAEFKPYM